MQTIRHNTRGISLLETVVYIGLLALMLPVLTTFLLRVRESQESNSYRWRIEDTSSLVLAEIRQELSEASSISISTSTLDSDTSSIVYTDNSGATYTLELATDQRLDSGTAIPIDRLQKQSAVNEWLTPDIFDVTIWRAEPIRRDGTLTGLRITITFTPLDANEEPFSTSTTIHLLPTISEL